MEFSEKLQTLRRQKGITQEELASHLYVSRTAISKWESGRGYPNIDSLKAIARFYSISLDELLSADEVLAIAHEDQKKNEARLRDLIFGALDLCASLLLFLPLFGAKEAGVVRAVSLLQWNGMGSYLNGIYLAIVIASILVGVLTLVLPGAALKTWSKSKIPLSLMLGSVALLLFVITQQPYAAVFAFSMLAIKAVLLIKRR